MEMITLSPMFAVSPQINVNDMEKLKAAGFKAIICNRPDGEAADQPAFEEIAAAAKTIGIEARYLPVAGGMVSAEDVAEFGEALRELAGPVLAYCRSGARSANLWSAWAESSKASSPHSRPSS